MRTTTQAFVTVDMRGLKAALVARARAERVSTSTVVRRAVERELGQVDAANEPACRIVSPALVKLSIRLTADEARALTAAANHEDLSRGAFVASLLTKLPGAADGPSRREYVAALGASCAELSTLSRNIHRLTSALREGRIQPARLDDRALEVIGRPIRVHLKVASRVLADLQTARRPRMVGAKSAPASQGSEHV